MARSPPASRDYNEGWCGAMVPAVWLVGLLIAGSVGAPEVRGVAPGIPEPEHRSVVLQLFNWRFEEIEAVLPRLREAGYSHLHVSPPQKSNERIWQWWGRYQPVDFTRISGPLGSEEEFRRMTRAAAEHGLQVIVDVVLNHTIDITEPPTPDFARLDEDRVVAEQFPGLEPRHFRPRRGCGSEQEKCWLFFNLMDLRTEDREVREIASRYLLELVGLGAGGFRFDAAKHIEPAFFPAVLAAVPDAYAFGEIIASSPDDFSAHLAMTEMDFYDFPLVGAMREAFADGGDLSRLKHARNEGRALPGVKAVTFVRNHDIDRGQAFDRGLEESGARAFYGIGWDEGHRALQRRDVLLAHAFIMGREDGLPYVFADMPTLPPDQQDDRFDDPDIAAAIRFHNLCLANPDGSGRRPEIWRIETPDTIGWQRGTDRFLVINKAADWFEIRNLATSLQPGRYQEVRNGWPLHVSSDGTIREWNVPPRSAMAFVWVGN